MTGKVLIVDDDLETLRLIEMILKRQGYQTVSVSSGEKALTSAESENPDLIILDVMMPDMDGFQVTHHIRKNARTTDIPILMFTAKSRVEDKVAGYESGVDEYLTKPIHPAELVARVGALIARSKQQAEEKCDRGYQIAVVAPRGGLGASTLTINLAIAFQAQTRQEVIAAELRPGRGSWVNDLCLSPVDSLNKLLTLKTNQITIGVIEQELVRTNFGVRLLLASNQIKDLELVDATAQMREIVNILPCLADLVLLDLGADLLPNPENIFYECNEVILVTEPYPGTMKRTKQRIDELTSFGIGKHKLLTVVAINRSRADLQLSALQMEEAIERPIAVVIPPSPEMAYQSGLHSIPLIQVQPQSLITQQFERFATMISERIPK